MKTVNLGPSLSSDGSAELSIQPNYGNHTQAQIVQPNSKLDLVIILLSCCFLQILTRLMPSNETQYCVGSPESGAALISPVQL